jgi:hypothetical protein
LLTIESRGSPEVKSRSAVRVSTSTETACRIIADPMAMPADDVAMDSSAVTARV